MEFKQMSELLSCKGAAYGGSLTQRNIKIPKRDWDALRAYAQGRRTSAGEIVRGLIRDFLNKEVRT